MGMLDGRLEVGLKELEALKERLTELEEEKLEAGDLERGAVEMA